MYDKPETPQQWSVHAEVTISHNPPNDGANAPTAPAAGVTHTEQSGNGLRMVYTWTSHPPESEYNSNVRSSAPPSTSAFQSDTASNKSSGAGNGFQREGMVFTSVPPRQQANPYDPNRLGVSVQDSGYNSELLSPSSCGPGSLRRPIIPYNRRCRSTCSIILSTAFNADGHNLKCDTSATAQPVSYHQCGRTQSLRCQTPSIKPERRDSYFGCGDPWCYHADDFNNRRCSPVLESCEECSISNQSGVSSKRASRANTFTTHFCTRVPERNRSSPPSFLDYRNKDMACQTVETREKCTSPFEKMELRQEKQNEAAKKKTARKLSDRRRSNYSSRRNSDSNVLSPSTLPVESADNKKSSKRITRSPAVLRGRSPLVDKKSSPGPESSKKQRTVHIDVYCTGSDCESETDSSTGSEEETQSSPQTVFESEKVRISRRKADSDELPYSLRNFLKENNSGGTIQDEQRRKLAAKLPLGQKHNSDSDEDASTAYPSALSSYSQMRDFESSMSSVPPSWSTMSTSSCTVPDDYESLANTSCKDTVSDFENLVMRKFSLAPDESEYFIPRRLQSADTSSDIHSRMSTGSLLPSDSFDYEDSEDRRRILEMERLWTGDPDQKTWKSPSSERKFMLQQQKMKEYLEKRVQKKSEVKSDHKESETESTEDDSEQGWSFVRNTDDGKSTLKRDVTVRRASRDAVEESENQEKKPINVAEPAKINKSEPTVPKNSVPVSASKIETPPGKVNPVPSVTNTNKNPPLATTQTKTVDNLKSDHKPTQFPVQASSSCTVIGLQHLHPNFPTPFTIFPGRYTEPLLKAQKFGTVIGAIRKPGHHVGPAKNPDCLCDHCRRYYEDSQTRSRTRSMGDNSDLPYNWREILKPRPVRNNSKTFVSDF